MLLLPPPGAAPPAPASCRSPSGAPPPVKQHGAYYTPVAVADALVRWAVRRPGDVLLDPACGDGRFVARHPNSVGVERSDAAVAQARQRAPRARLHQGDFFAWAMATGQRFDGVVGNPPFIRYQTFTGAVRRRALARCAELGAPFSGLTASWAPFLVVAASLLRRGGRMAFVVPASIGHAPYAAPLLEYLVRHFSLVRVVPVKRKLFPRLSEDCWLLFADGFGGAAGTVRFAPIEHIGAFRDAAGQAVSVPEWRQAWNRRLRPYLLPAAARSVYRAVAARPDSLRLGAAASVGIGYVSGANEFFHLRPSQAVAWGIPDRFLQPTVRSSRGLPSGTLSASTVDAWRRGDEPMLLLRLPRGGPIPPAVRNYLDSEPGQRARQAYKCRTRRPWYAVPDVPVPAFFLTYMSGAAPSLVRNAASVSCTNALHAVNLRSPGVCGRSADRRAGERLAAAWTSTFVQLSCELEGHALGGGLLKLEPGEAARVVLPSPETLQHLADADLRQAVATLRRWRHCRDVP